MSSFAPSVLALLDQKSLEFGSRTALSTKEKDVWCELSYEELSQRSRLVSARLMRDGLALGERVALLSESRPEWGIAFFSAVLGGGIVVPLDAKLNETELGSILTDSAPVVLLASSTYWDLASSLRAATPSLREVIRIDDFLGAIEPPADPLPTSRERDPEELAVLIYTSGTTGPPKGVMITFSNLVFQASRLERVMETGAGDCFLSVLPLHHLLELTGGFLAALHSGAEICYARSLYPQDLIALMHARRVSVILGVPLLFRTLKESLEREVRRRPWRVRVAWNVAMTLAQALPVDAWRRALFAAVHQRLGGRLRLLVSGGARLDDGTAEFFDRLGVPLLQGYGLTETSPVVSVNTLRANRIGSVGRPLEGVEIEILTESDGAKDGEILTRGPHVMHGYYRREDLTRQVIDPEGWLHTGDLGFVDRDGFLHITGRKKNVIALGSGKKVQPEEVEAVLASGNTVKEVCVLGRIADHGIARGTEEVWAVAVPSDAVREQYRARPELLEEEVRKELEVLALRLAPFKRPASIVCFPEELPKTATRKTKRFLVEAWLNAREARS